MAKVSLLIGQHTGYQQMHSRGLRRWQPLTSHNGGGGGGGLVRHLATFENETISRSAVSHYYGLVPANVPLAIDFALQTAGGKQEERVVDLHVVIQHTKTLLRSTT